MKFLKVLTIIIFSTQVFAQPNPSILGAKENPQHDQMPETQRMYYWQRNKKNQLDLINRGKLIQQKGSHPLYIFPLSSNLVDPSFYGTSNYVDMEANFNNGNASLLDYNCGHRTYDTSSGYNHRGIDFFTWPHGWHKMNKNQVTVVAAASGVITDKIDGNPDKSCSLNVATNWNYIAITHSDNSYAWYGHMKSGSLTSKEINQTVVAGEYLGVVGSSGISTGPHLHFETYTSTNQLIEPFMGTCNIFNADSWWLTQPSYFESKITKLTTHASIPTPPYPTCDNKEDTPNFQNIFSTPARVYITRYYQDQLFGHETSVTVLKPDGSAYVGWNETMESGEHYLNPYWYNYIDIPTGFNELNGEWIFQVEYQGVTTQHKFYINDLIFKSGFE